MSKMIIHSAPEIPELLALDLVRSVILKGRVSNNNTQFCYLTVFKVGKRTLHVATDLNRKSDRFTIYQPDPETAPETWAGESK